MIYAPLVERGFFLMDLGERPIDELKAMVRLINRLEAYRAGSAINRRYESGYKLSESPPTAEEARLLENYAKETMRAKEYGNL